MTIHRLSLYKQKCLNVQFPKCIDFKSLGIWTVVWTKESIRTLETVISIFLKGLLNNPKANQQFHRKLK